MGNRSSGCIAVVLALGLAGCSAGGSSGSQIAELPGPDPSVAQIGVGRMLLRTDPAQAERLFLTVLKRSPDNAAALNDLGIARDIQGRHSEAQTAYRAALKAEPGLRAARVNLALSLALSRDFSGAVQTAQSLEDGPATDQTERVGMEAVSALVKVPVADLPSAGVVRQANDVDVR